MLEDNQAFFDYDTKLQPSELTYPTLCVLRNVETGEQFIPAKKHGDVYELPYIVSGIFGTTTCHKKDLKYFGIKEKDES